MEVFFLSLAKIQILYYIGNQFIIKFYSFYDSPYIIIMATFLFSMIVLALLALVVTLVVFTLSQRKKARLQNPHDSYHGHYRA